MMWRLLLVLCLVWPHSVWAKDFSYRDFAKLPVQHEGRVKPLDTFARALIYTFNGHQSVDGLSPELWLAETLFDPAAAMQRPLFRIFRPDLIGLAERESKYYSFAEIMPALQTQAPRIEALLDGDEKDWTEDQREMVRLWEASILYTQLLRSFSYVLPLDIAVPPAVAKTLKLPEDGPYTLRQLQPHGEDLKKRVQRIIRQKGEDPVRYTAEERAIAELAMNVQIFEMAGRANALLRIIPGKDEIWQTPWSIAQPDAPAYLRIWEDMARAFQTQDAAAWSAATRAAYAMHGGDKLALEVAYNKSHLLLITGITYMAAFCGIIFFSLRGHDALRRLSFAALASGAVVHSFIIAARVIILERAPVGTLYESILFVALVCVVAALVMEWIRKDGQGVLIGALCGLLLLFIANAFVEGDTMKVLVAVLNTNFWLSTHVLCITMGYGWCLLAAVLGHIALFRAATGREDKTMMAPVTILSLIALLFTAVGTILGGIWADQSWGRFWGWDPKENGALLIVLWLIWILHGRLGGQLDRLAYYAGVAALSIIVALAWFGVNLLSVGLHSYGFITGVAGGLAAFCGAEILLIASFWHSAGRRAA